MFVNLSNHPSEQWSAIQLKEAAEYGKIIDIPFPKVDPEGGMEMIENLASEYENKIRKLNSENIGEKLAVHIMGELTLCFALVLRLQRLGIKCLASTTSRQTEDNEDGSKTSRFEFVRFREYKII